MHPQHSYCKSYCRYSSLGIWKPYLHFTASLQSFVLRANGSLSNPCLFLPVFSTTYPCSDYILLLPLFAKESNSRSARSLAGAVRSTEHKRVSTYMYRYVPGDSGHNPTLLTAMVSKELCLQRLQRSFHLFSLLCISPRLPFSYCSQVPLRTHRPQIRH